jgi:hypothetical protein
MQQIQGFRFSEDLNLFSKWVSALLELQSCRQQQQEEEDLGVVATPGNGNLSLSLSLPPSFSLSLSLSSLSVVELCCNLCDDPACCCKEVEAVGR